MSDQAEPRPINATGRPPLAGPIVLVDDTEQNLYTVGRYLRRAGFEVWEGRTGADALRLASRGPSLVILDVKLPDIHGYEVCRRIKTNPATASIPVLHTSATFMDTLHKVEGLEGGADGYMTAPIKPEELIATVRALLRLHAAERAAREASNHWQTTFDAVSSGICLVDREGRIERCNTAMAELLGESANTITGAPVARIAATVAADPDAFAGLVASGRRENRETRVGERWWRVTLDPVPDPTGGLNGAVCVVTDISDRVRSEQRLRTQYEVTRVLVESLDVQETAGRILRAICEPAGWKFGVLWRVEPNGELACLELWHAGDVGPPELTAAVRPARLPRDVGLAGHAWAMGRPVGLSALEAPPAFRSPFAPLAAAAGFRAALAVPVRFRDQIFGVFEFLGDHIGEPDTELLEVLRAIGDQLGLFIERRQAEAALAAAEEKLRAYAAELEQRVAERTAKLQESNQALESFCYTIAHDLRAPLRAVEGLTGVLLEDYAPHFDLPGQDHAKRIMTAARRMDRLLNDLLAYGRISHHAIELQWLELGPVIRAAISPFRKDLAEPGAELRIDEPLPAVHANATLLEQVIANLVGNAIKFQRDGLPPKIHIRAEDRPASVLITIRDEGIGIDPRYVDRIFEVFERLNTAHSVPGTGIGLAIVKRAVQRMRGTCGVESTPGEGSCFWFELPKA